jgi:hypothetical protein
LITLMNKDIEIFRAAEKRRRMSRSRLVDDARKKKLDTLWLAFISDINANKNGIWSNL